jgi:uncharacterized protein
MPSIDQARAWYPANDAVHGFDHVLRVYHLAERLALAEGADLEIVRAAVLLHDAQGSQNGDFNDPSQRAQHHHDSAQFAAQVLEAEGWKEGRIAEVQHCIRAHRFRDDTEQPGTLEAQVLFDADKLDAIGAIGVARAVAYSVRDGMPFYAEPSLHFLETGHRLPGEEHSSYHEFLFKLCKLKDRLYTSSGRRLAEERHRFLVEYYEHLAAEMRGEI